MFGGGAGGGGGGQDFGCFYTYRFDSELHVRVYNNNKHSPTVLKTVHKFNILSAIYNQFSSYVRLSVLQ